MPTEVSRRKVRLNDPQLVEITLITYNDGSVGLLNGPSDQGAPAADANAWPMLIRPRDSAAADVSTPVANTAAVVTYAAGGAGVRHVISGIAWSYSAAPTGGRLTVEDGAGNVVLSIDITAAGPGYLPFAVPKRGSANTAMIVTLAAGGAGISGRLSILSHWT